MPSRACLALAVALGLCACGAGTGPSSSATPAPSSPGQACVSPPAAVGPDVAGSLGAADAGGSFCLQVGQRLSVFLSVPPDQAATGRWRPITAADTTVLQPAPNGALTLVVGVTGAEFAAAAAGSSRITSTRPPCPSTDPAGCPGGQGWEATIVVRP